MTVSPHPFPTEKSEGDGLGVVIVTFNSADVVLDCLESLLAARPRPRIVVVDNASTDDTVRVLRDWAAGLTAWSSPADLPFALAPAPKPLSLSEHVDPARPAPPDGAVVTLIHSGANRGFAGGVNVGLAWLAADPAIGHFWVLNPDGVVTPETPAAWVAAATATPGYGLMGGRVCYVDPPGMIQIDGGGTVNRWTGVTHNLALGANAETTPPPAADALEFITGANVVASRAFYETVGPMREDYFLYYEEVDWALRRGALPIIYAPGARVYHRAGTSIGSPTLARFASPFSMYFKYRARMMFVRRFNPVALPLAYAYGLAKAGQIALGGGRREAVALLRGLHGMAPPAEVAARLSREARARVGC